MDRRAKGGRMDGGMVRRRRIGEGSGDSAWASRWGVRGGQKRKPEILECRSFGRNESADRVDLREITGGMNEGCSQGIV